MKIPKITERDVVETMYEMLGYGEDVKDMYGFEKEGLSTDKEGVVIAFKDKTKFKITVEQIYSK